MINDIAACEEDISLFLTGGTGFFGRSILRYLIETKRRNKWPQLRVTVLTRSPANFLARYGEFNNLPWLSFQAGDILADVSSLPLNETFSHVLHAAADSTIGPQLANLDRYDQIVAGTRNILDFAIRVGAKRFLLTSSGGAYGAQPLEMERIQESYNGMPDPMDANNVYGVSKRLAEHLCILYQDQYPIETVVARCFAFVGPDLPLNAHFAIGNFIRDALVHEEITINGNGTPIRSYLYQDDLAEWLLTLLTRGKSGHSYNVGSDEAISIANLAQLIRDIISPKKTVKIRGAVNEDSTMRSRYVPDITKARTHLGLGVLTPLSDAIRLTAQLVAKNPKGYSAHA